MGIGLWISFDNGNSFQQYKNDYPPVSTYDLAIQEREADLVIATFGRSLYVLDNIMPLRKIAASKGQLLSKQLTSFEAPASYMVRYKNPSGYNSSPWGMYEGGNRNPGAEYSFFVKPSLKTDSNLVAKKPAVIIDTTQKRMSGAGDEDLSEMEIDSSKASIGLRAPKDSATIKIYNESNELIRTLKVKADSGFNRNYWGFEMKGVPPVKDPADTSSEGRGFGRSRGNRGGEPAGEPVFPGTYKFVISLYGVMDSTVMIVKADPDIPVSKEMYDARMKVLKRLEKSTARLVAVNDQLNDAEKTIKRVDATLTGLDAKQSAQLRKLNTVMTDSIKNICDYIFGRKQEKQGYGTPYQVTVNGRLQEANAAVAGKNKIPDAQEVRLTEEAEFLVSDVVGRANNFFSTKE